MFHGTSHFLSFLWRKQYHRTLSLVPLRCVVGSWLWRYIWIYKLTSCKQLTSKITNDISGHEDKSWRGNLHGTWEQKKDYSTGIYPWVQRLECYVWRRNPIFRSCKSSVVKSQPKVESFHYLATRIVRFTLYKWNATLYKWKYAYLHRELLFIPSSPFRTLPNLFNYNIFDEFILNKL